MLLILEGPDGVGKTTQIKQVAEMYRSLGHEVVETREPGGTELGVMLRAFMLDHKSTSAPLSDVFGMQMDRAQHHHEIVAPALARGAIVVCDRMFESTMVYQGYLKRRDREKIHALNRFHQEGDAPLTPYLNRTVVVMLDAPDEVLEARLAARMAEGASDDKHDAAGGDFRQRVRDGYRAAYQDWQERVSYSIRRVENCDLDPRTVTERIFAAARVRYSAWLSDQTA
jgi:dTMP kinase